MVGEHLNNLLSVSHMPNVLRMTKWGEPYPRSILDAE
jgi:hypothetical protein